MTEVSFLPCWLAPTRQAADGAVARLAEAGIDARVASPSDRYSHLPPGSWEVRVPAGDASRASALLLSQPA